MQWMPQKGFKTSSSTELGSATASLSQTNTSATTAMSVMFRALGGRARRTLCNPATWSSNRKCSTMSWFPLKEKAGGEICDSYSVSHTDEPRVSSALIPPLSIRPSANKSTLLNANNKLSITAMQIFLPQCQCAPSRYNTNHSHPPQHRQVVKHYSLRHYLITAIPSLGHIWLHVVFLFWCVISAQTF